MRIIVVLLVVLGVLSVLLAIEVATADEGKLPQRPPIPDIVKQIIYKTKGCNCTNPEDCICPAGQCSCEKCGFRRIDKVIQTYENPTYYLPSPIYHGSPGVYRFPSMFAAPPPGGPFLGGPMMGGMACGPGG